MLAMPVSSLTSWMTCPLTFSAPAGRGVSSSLWASRDRAPLSWERGHVLVSSSAEPEVQASPAVGVGGAVAVPRDLNWESRTCVIRTAQLPCCCMFVGVRLHVPGRARGVRSTNTLTPPGEVPAGSGPLVVLMAKGKD